MKTAKTTLVNFIGPFFLGTIMHWLSHYVTVRHFWGIEESKFIL